MLLPFFTWLESLHFGAVVDNSGYFVAMVNVTHLLALAIFVGAVLVLDLRLIGSGMSKQPVARVSKNAQPWLIGGFLALAITGILQIVATPMKVYYSANFWTKVDLLVVAVLFTFIVRRRVAQMDDARLGPVWGKVVGLVSIVLWMTIAVEGRLIGLLQ
jgi:hypothetical protein